jgi:transposase
MQIKELLKDVLALDHDWIIGQVSKDDNNRTILVELKYRKNKQFVCPICQCPVNVIHDHKERTWRHIDLGVYKTVLRAAVPRINCPQCGVNQIKVPWAEKHMRITGQLQRQLVSGLLAMCAKDVCRMYQVTWQTVSIALERTIARLRQVKRYDHVRVIGIDEIAIRKGYKYLTVVYDLDAGEVIWIGKERTYETLCQFIDWFGRERFRTLDNICCDMWDPYLKAIKEHRGETGIVFDKFHIKKHLNDAVDLVRKAEHRTLTEQGIALLKKTKYIWLKNPCNLSDHQEATFKELKQHNLKVMRAYELKELFNYFWQYAKPAWATKFFESWCRSVSRSRLQPMKKTAQMLKSYWYGVINYITAPITNAKPEGINCKIRVFTKRAYGYSTFTMMANMIFLGCGGLNLQPLTS